MPPGPPRVPATVGPAEGIDPVCAVAAVCTATSASSSAPPSPPASTTGPSHGTKPLLRPSSTYAHTEVTANVTPSVADIAGCSRRRQGSAAPIPTSAPIAGASTTV